jgi:tRNA pseudouridine55 synthase
MLGFINLNKPVGFTSHDCVARVRRLLKIKKVGHGGTLDPAATGVLPIAVGKATRLLQFLPERKVYLARIRLGVNTTTDDLEGEVIAAYPRLDLSLEEIKKCLNKFRGNIEQIPPIYSAIKQDGKKLYEIARKGEIVEIPPRKVTIEKIEIIDFFPGEFNEVEVEIVCSPGTYIRAIARDLGASLSIGGTLAALTRKESCGMSLADSITLEQLAEKRETNSLQLIPPEKALQHLDELALDYPQAKGWCQGKCIPVSIHKYSEKKLVENTEKLLRVHDEEGRFLGIGILSKNNGGQLIMPKIVCSN